MKEDIGFLIKKINETIEKHANCNLKCNGVTLAQLRVLCCINKREARGENTSQKDIEKFLEVSHPTVVGILKTMEEKELITTGFDSADKRVKNVYEAQKAKDMKVDFEQSRMDMEKKLMEGFTEKEKEELYRMLIKVYGNIK